MAACMVGASAFVECCIKSITHGNHIHHQLIVILFIPLVANETKRCRIRHSPLPRALRNHRADRLRSSPQPISTTMKTDRYGNEYDPAITTKDIKLQDKVIPAGTEFFAMARVMQAHSRTLATLPAKGSPPCRSCTGLDVNSIWDDEFEFVISN